MDKSKRLTENIKIRVSLDEKNFIEQAAKKNGISISDLIRRSILDETDSSIYAINIQHNRIKHEIRNKIISMDISKKTKNKILKELENID